MGQMSDQQEPSEGDHVGTVSKGLCHQTPAAVAGDSCVGVDVGAAHTLTSFSIFLAVWHVKIHDANLGSQGAIGGYFQRGHLGVQHAAPAPPTRTLGLKSSNGSSLKIDSVLKHEFHSPQRDGFSTPEAFCTWVTILRCNILPHVKMLHRSARCRYAVRSDRMFSLNRTDLPTTTQLNLR